MAGTAGENGFGADGRSTLDDAINGHRLFLGRHAASGEELLLVTGRSLPEFLNAFLVTAEFMAAVVDRLASGALLPHASLAAEMDEALHGWALRRLPLSQASRDALVPSRSWRFWLLTLLRDEALLALLPPRVVDWLEQSGARRRLAAVELAPIRRLAGEVSYDGGGRISGWCANLSDPTETVLLELFLADRFIGVVQCRDFLPGLSERTGGSGEHGFAFLIPPLHDDLTARGVLLHVRDVQSKTPFGSAIYIRETLPGRQDDLGRILHALRGIKDALRSIEQTLPDVLATTEPPVDAYPALKQAGLLRNWRAPALPAVSPQGLVHILLLRGEGDPGGLRGLIRSLESQRHADWTLTVVLPPAAAPSSEVAALLHPLAARGQGGVAAYPDLSGLLASDPRLSGAAAHLILDGAVEFGEDALPVFLDALSTAPMVYSDHELAVEGGGDPAPDPDDAVIPVLKPGFDPVMLLSCDCIGPLAALSGDVLLRALAVEEGMPSDSHDLMLRLVDAISADGRSEALPADGGVRHIPSMLYTVRRPADFRSAGALPRALSGSQEAVGRWVRRHAPVLEVGIRAGRVPVPMPAAPGLDRALVDPCDIELGLAAPPFVSVIVPTRNSPVLLRNCLDSLLRVRQTYPGRMQILVIDHENEDPDAVALIAAMKAGYGVDVLPYAGPFNWSAMNNAAAAQAAGEVLVFLNDDTVAADRGWLGRAVATLALPKVGVVGARLLYPDGGIQHGGIVTSRERGATHEAIGARSDDGGYLGRNALLRSAAAVTGACLVTRRAVFEAAGGFDPRYPADWSDITYCLTVRKSGARVIYDPKVCLYHFESKTRGRLSEASAKNAYKNHLRHVVEEWGDFMDDPYFNKAFSRLGDPFSRLVL